jgi:hypothetical protein
MTAGNRWFNSDPVARFETISSRSFLTNLGYLAY